MSMSFVRRLALWLCLSGAVVYGGGCSFKALGADVISAVGTGNGANLLSSLGLSSMLNPLLGAAT